ncbi:neuromedin-U isoform X3 [Ambystoma mexicanum]|uniref:neuromedin-U isoform X3 n=1 Tax=Ambystoma mexicanum TaxID=8296 RepID=UPI0037E84201
MRLGGCRQPAVQSSHTRSCGPRGQLPPVCSAPLLLLLLLLASCICVCGGAPFPAQVRQAEQELQLWNEIDDACSHFLSTEPQPQASSALEELCFTVVGILQKSQGLDEKDNTKRDELQGPGGIQSRGYFLFRPRNGRRSAGFR